jgi:hypothetical protein
MKKPREIKRLNLSRETLATLDRLEGTQLEKAAGGLTASSCRPHCTCFGG